MRRTLIMTMALCSMGTVAVWSASVTVSKPGNGGTYTTVQAGVVAAGAGGTVTILDSAVYTEDVTIQMAQAGLTIQAAAGQTPTIEAANAVNRYGAIGVTSPADRFGIAVMAPCTFAGLKIRNTSPQVNQLGANPLVASAVFVNSPNVAFQNCEISGPGTASVPGGDWVAVLVVALSATPSSASLVNCEVHHAEYGVVPSTFQANVPGLPDSLVRMTGCYIHDCLESGYQADAGNTTLLNCRITSNTGSGVEIGGGSAYLQGCDITNNRQDGLALDWDSGFNAGRTNYPVAFVKDCLLFKNGTGERNVNHDDGLLTLDHCIISQGNNGGILLRNASPADANLNINFCDIYAPGKTCITFEGAGANLARASIRNSILVGDNGVNCQAAHRANVCFSDVVVPSTGTAFQNTLTSNTVEMDPLYDDPTAAVRSGFLYHNDYLNVGEGGALIGSQGRWKAAADRRRWQIYR
ncbi:MAG: right-handed parallel beta-helix repeat-containing protein [Candidatus Sumerlaeia bacterium]|nr:right-handed parallel beta-helix repeat-containing protein [Candidatus Sumerlaeia bacterium]